MIISYLAVKDVNERKVPDDILSYNTSIVLQLLLVGLVILLIRILSKELPVHPLSSDDGQRSWSRNLSEYLQKIFLSAIVHHHQQTITITINSPAPSSPPCNAMPQYMSTFNQSQASSLTRFFIVDSNLSSRRVVDGVEFSDESHDMLDEGDDVGSEER